MRLENGRLLFAATDLSNHASCAHLTMLNREDAFGTARAKKFIDPLAAILAERGAAHEAAYLAHLVATYAAVEHAQHLDNPISLMERGVDVIVQPRLNADGWAGRADFLIKVPRSCPKWEWSYEVVDTKLATNTRAGTLLQLCAYSDLVGRLQGDAPEQMHVVKPGPGFPRESYRFREFGAIYRLIRADLESTANATPQTYPEPCSHCDVCEWRKLCDAQRRADDHLSLVVDLRRLHQRELELHGIGTVAQLAQVSPLPFQPERGAVDTYERLIQQARLQLEARRASTVPVEMLPVEDGRGLNRLPAPSDGDVFMDLEGDPFVGPHGREYLFGSFTIDDGYRAAWALDEESERRAFVELIDYLMSRWARYPDMHVYHFAPYEPSSLKRLAGRYARCGDDVDRLLRGVRFIDLYAISRQAFRAGVESYSIKSLEAIIGYTRQLRLDTAAQSLRGVCLALQRDAPTTITPEWLRDVEAYNRDDCEAARALRDWLEQRRADAIAQGSAIVRPPLLTGERPDPEAKSAASEVAARLLEGVPADAAERSSEQTARWLLGNLMEWYRREDKAEWWEFFRLAELDDSDRVVEQRCLAGLQHVQRAINKKTVVDTYTFPVQDVMMKRKDDLYADAKTPIGTLHEIDPATRTLQIKKTADSAGIHPTSVFAHKDISPRPKDGTLLALGQGVTTNGIPAPSIASVWRDILFRCPPRGVSQPGQPLVRAGESVEDCLLRLLPSLDGTVLPIQGPPGSGKTELAAKAIVELVRAGKRVGITAASHAVIENLALRVKAIARDTGQSLTMLLKAEQPETPRDPEIQYINVAGSVDAKVKTVDVTGGTTWQWARPSMAGTVDVLVIDEAGQLSLADALTVSACATSMILVGDPQQLDQPLQGTHPDGVAVSVLKHMIGERETVEFDRGLFVGHTHRLHPRICAYTSEQFYEGRLAATPACATQTLTTGPLREPGLYWLPLSHRGCQNRSLEEAAAVAVLVQALLAGSATWSIGNAQATALRPSDILIVTPYNAQVATLRDALVAAGVTGVPVGTVDKFQGQQAPISIYSMATSTPADAPRGLAFLYDRHRLNVATSRARCASIVACSDSLIRPDCKTPEHLHLASALCRFVEMATRLTSAPSG